MAAVRCQSRAAPEVGAAALLMLIVLIATSSLALTQVATRGGDRDAAEQRARRLGKAREALLAYAVGYIDLYGPRGAGPGHLPCPDTDFSIDSNLNNGRGTNFSSRIAARTQADWRRDGPNPPCGSGRVAVGHLPRHISLPTHRYSFHSEPNQRLWYAVSTGFINNPVNRVVNPASKGTLQVDREGGVVAVIIDPDPDSLPDAARGDTAGQFSRLATALGNDRLTMIGMDSLRRAMTRRVGLWLRDRYALAARARCARTPSADGDEDERTASLVCRPYAQECHDERRIHWLADIPVKCSPGTGRRSVDAVTVVDGQHEARLEDVPLSAHWFMRNRWYEHLRLAVAQECTGLALDACRFRIGTPGTGDPAIRIELVPVEPVEP